MSDWKQGLFGYGDAASDAGNPWTSQDVWADPLSQPGDMVQSSSSDYTSPPAEPVPVSTWVWLAAGVVVLAGASLVLGRRQRKKRRRK